MSDRLRDHLELFAAGAATPTIGVDLAVNYRVAPPAGRVLLTVPAGYFMDARQVRALADRLGRAADQLEAFGEDAAA